MHLLRQISHVTAFPALLSSSSCSSHSISISIFLVSFLSTNSFPLPAHAGRSWIRMSRDARAPRIKNRAPAPVQMYVAPCQSGMPNETSMLTMTMTMPRMFTALPNSSCAKHKNVRSPVMSHQNSAWRISRNCKNTAHGNARNSKKPSAEHDPM